MVDDVLTLERAFAALRCVDAQYMEIYLDYCGAAGEAPCGQPGYPLYSTVAEIADVIETRKGQIDQLKVKINQLRNNPDPLDAEASARILAVTDALGINVS